MTATAGAIGSPTGLHRPAGTTAESGWSTVVTPESAGWGFTGLRVATLAPGGRIELVTGGDEAIVLPLAGAFRVEAEGETIDLDGRRDPFAGPTDFAYVPRDARLSIESPRGGRVAVATARTERRLTVRHGAAAGVPIELRGAGPASRLVRNFATPAAFDADRLIAVEVITPAGNWSSWPPHKHDEAGPAESVLEEIYYFEVAAAPDGAPGIGYQRVYGTPDRPIDVLVEVRDGDVVLIPHGWHGPAMAAPGYDLYYLNVMAGPDDERAWRISDDPAHAWVRGTWPGQPIDPRIAGLARPGEPGQTA
ncbi:MAG TPA: 5-deoxy-glucuronate isomerase [Candidatus Limnocylindrales bacterium]|nr:5-deoxy-glucuronate isomerase [Candidatus Limnocylindrales bacterium]